MNILVVCTGNTCRSPMAEALLRDHLARRGVDAVTVRSAGTSAITDSPASDGALLVALEREVDLSMHRARPLTAELVRDADLVLAMAPHHVERIAALGGAGRAHLLTAFARGGEGRAVNDPFGGDLATYRETFEQLDAELARVADRLATDAVERSARERGDR